MEPIVITGGLEKISITETLKEMLFQSGTADDMVQVVSVLEDVKSLKEQIEYWNKVQGPKETMIDLYAELDGYEAERPQEVKDQISCRMGCAHCCHIDLHISEMEADVLLDYAEENNIPVYVGLLIEQKEAGSGRSKLKNSGCVFLDGENKCKVYPVRPSNCRNYSVVTEPALCDNKVHEKGQVGRIPNYKAELLSSAMGNVSKAGDIASMLLKSIDKRTKEHHAENQ
jgi:hypothetical protein